MYKRILCLLLGLLPCAALGEEAFLQPSVQIYDRNGAPMRGLLSANNTYYSPVLLSEISPWFIAAAVAVEDKRFYQHAGVDAKAILRALWQNTQKGEVFSGASTITQQLVRSVHPRPKTWWGKAGEAWQALAWENNHTKEEILEDYFNRLELGNLTQGVQAAAQFYFGVDAKDVSLAQAAFLVGLAKSPTKYNPLLYLSRAVKRRNYVLARMQEEGFIDEEMKTRALEEPVQIRASQRPFEAPHFVNLLRSYLPEGISRINTSLDKEVQLYAEELVKNYIKKLAEQQVTNAAVVVIENATGGVLAYVGSADFHNAANQGQVDGARALRQPGSSLKPFVYGLAFEKGVLTPSSLLADEDTFFEGGFRPRNYDESFHGQISVREALANSYNIPAVKAAEITGVDGLLQILRQAGLTELSRGADYYGLGLSLGNGEVQLLHLTAAYAALARGGIYQPLTLAFEPLVRLPGKNNRVFSEQTAYLITHILADNQARAVAFGLNSSLVLPFELAAKTGTSKDYKDNFTLAYTPRWTIGVWAGNFDASPMQKVSGITGAGPIMHDLAMFLQQKYPSEPFAVPPGITHAKICMQSGLLASEKCTHAKEDIFNASHLPRMCSGSHQKEKEILVLLAPSRGDIYQWDPSIPASQQRLLWKASCAKKSGCRWKLNGKQQRGTACEVWWPLQVGKHRLEVSCGSEKAESSFEVLP